MEFLIVAFVLVAAVATVDLSKAEASSSSS
jgi:hypothetical protein